MSGIPPQKFLRTGIATPSAWAGDSLQQLVVADVNGDGRSDVVTAKGDSTVGLMLDRCTE